MIRRFGLLMILPIFLVGTLLMSQSTVKNPHGNLKWDCQDCHTTDSWSTMREDLKFDHATTGFQLVGAHDAAMCIGCHKDPVFSHVSTSCIDCHTDQHQGQLGTDCMKCHNTRDWSSQQNTFEVHAARGFALVGAHTVADCESCHLGQSKQEFAGTATDCFSCHQQDFNATVEPAHAELGFSMQCQDCHSASRATWTGANFSHPATFPLIGGHQGVACQSCHPSGYANTPTDCYSCHQPDFLATSAPAHVSNGFPHDCLQCHTITAWQPANYDHNATAFPLTGAHVQTACITCHATQFAGTPTACIACHQTDFNQTSNPNHQLAAFDQNCLSCHTTGAWQPSSFNHATTGYLLTGAHVSATCTSCHATQFSGTPTGCYSCHQSDFQSVSSPNHVTQGFSQDCTSCHTTSGWSPSSFNHATTSFPLTGQHTTVNCVSCHPSNYAGTPSTCISCHQTDFNQTTEPNHQLANFDQNCLSCHTTAGWKPSSFNHASTGFSLTGQHTTALCSSCHSTQFAGTQTNCVACHQTDFNGTSNPNHTAASFPTTCQTCHSTSGWTPSSWDHDAQYFPINSGAHSNVNCIQCHTVPNTFTTFSCIDCHTHSKTTTDNHHTEVNNYQYLSSACYSCHPRGRS